MANYNTIPGNISITPGQTVQRKLDDSGWEGTTLITAAQMAAKADLVSGVVPAAQLPSYVDDVLEYANLAAFPGTGETGKIYVALDTNLVYRWSGSTYVNIAAGLALGETLSTAYRGDRGKTAFDHSQITSGNPHNTIASDLGLATVASTGVYSDLTGKPTIPTILPRSFNNVPGRSIVTGTGATGFQPSSTRDAQTNYSINTSTTATIGGASSAVVVLEIAPTNSVTPGDWVEIGRTGGGQNITLAIALQSVQTLATGVSGVVPAGYYAKLRSITSGTASAAYASGQEILQ